MYTIYTVINLVNGKTYVGQTINPKARWRGHLSDANRGLTHPLYQAIRKYGKENFIFHPLLEVETQQEADYQEQIWIALLRAHRSQDGYVVSVDGKGHLGYTEEDRARRGQSFVDSLSKREGPHWSTRTDITPERVCQMYYDQGIPTKKIAETLGCSYDIVLERMKDAGRPVGKGNHHGSYVQKSYTVPVDEDMLRKLYNDGLSNNQISKNMGISRKVIRNRLLSLGLPLDRPIKWPTWTLSEERKTQISESTSKAWREGKHDAKLQKAA